MLGQGCLLSGEDLLRKILTSRHFAHASTLKQVLTYLYERSAAGTQDGPKEYEIATRAMGRPPSFDPQMDPVVRVTVSQIRKRLDAYFQSEGAALPLRLEIPRGRYVTLIRSNRITLQAGRMAQNLERFWREFRDPVRAPLILYTEPLFFTNHRGLFVRHWLANDEANPERLLQAEPALQALRLSPTYHYFSAGEMRCLLSLDRFLASMGIQADSRNSRHFQREELARHHAVLLGSPRTNVLLEELQRGLPLRVTADAVEWQQPGGRRRRWQHSHFRHGQEPLVRCWAVLSRFRLPGSGNTVILIASNHGGAIEGIGHALTLEESVDELTGRLNARPGRTMPEFQALVEVVVGEVDGEIRSFSFRQVEALGEPRVSSALSAAAAPGG